MDGGNSKFDSRLEQSEKDTADGELLPSLDEAHSEHDGAPEDYNRRKVDAASDLPHENVGSEGRAERAGQRLRAAPKRLQPTHGSSKTTYGAKKMAEMILVISRQGQLLKRRRRGDRFQPHL